MRRYSGLAIIGFVCLAAALSEPRPSFAADPKQGERTFNQWCTSCHIKKGAKRAGDAAPPLIELLQKKSLTPDAMRRWLANPHPPMPNLNLGRQEIENLVAYFQSQRGK